MIKFQILCRIVGCLAGLGTTVSFVPQVVHVVRDNAVKDLSVLMFIIHSSGVIMWITYGFLIKDLVVVSFNATTLVLNAIILAHILRDLYRQKMTLPITR